MARRLGFGWGRHRGGARSPFYKGGAFAPVKAALANRATTPVNIVFDAHSWGEGSSVWTRGSRMVDIFQTQLETLLPTAGVSTVGGTTYVVCDYAAAGSPTSHTYSSLLGGFLGGPQAAGFGRRCFGFDTVGHGARYNYTCTDLDIHWFNSNNLSGTLRVQIDGGTTEGVNQFTINTTTGTANAWNKTSITGLSNASHQIDVTCTATGTNTTFFAGMMVYRGNASKGIRVIDASRAASVSTDNNSGDTQLKLLNGYTVVVLCRDVNDYNNQIAAGTLQTNMAARAAEYRAQLGASTVIVNTLFNAPNNLGARTPNWSTFEGTARTIIDSDAFMCGNFLSNVFPNAATDGGVTIWDADLLHPRSPAGHTLAGNTLAARFAA